MSEPRQWSTQPATDGGEADAGSRFLDERYGRGRQRGIDRRVGWTVAGAAVLGGIAVLVFGGWQSSAGIEYQDIGRTIVNDHRVDVRFEATTPAHTPVACAIEAQNQTKAVVGWKIVELPVSDQRTHSVSTSVVTTNTAATGSVKSCWPLEASGETGPAAE